MTGREAKRLLTKLLKLLSNLSTKTPPARAAGAKCIHATQTLVRLSNKYYSDGQSVSKYQPGKPGPSKWMQGSQGCQGAGQPDSGQTASQMECDAFSSPLPSGICTMDNLKGRSFAYSPTLRAVHLIQNMKPVSLVH